MHNAIFISDLHLCPTRPGITKQFINFLQQQALTATHLYILGDFFEQWPGDDCLDAMSIEIIQALKHYTQTTKIPTFFVHGNRDFLISKKFCEHAGITLIKDPTVIEINQQRIIITHGDYMCIDDKPYQRLRKFTSSNLAKKIFMRLPKQTRKNIWQKGRNKSKQIKSTAAAYLGDINLNFSIEECQRLNCNLLIHGHTHQPVIDHLDATKQIQRLTLPCWEEQAGYATVNQNGLQLHYLELTIGA